MNAGVGRLLVTAGMASYLDAGALVASGLALGGFYRDSLSLSDSNVGVLLGLQTLCFATGAVVGGRLGDRLGRRDVLWASLVMYAAGVLVLASASGVPWLVVGVVLSGLAIGGDLPTSLALISEEAPLGQRGRLVASTQLLWVAGIATTGMLAYAVADLGVLAGRILYAHLLVVALVVLLFRMTLSESEEWSHARRVADQGRHRPGSHIRARLRVAATSPVTPLAFALGSYYALWNLGANTLGQFKPYLWIQELGGSERGAAALVLAGLPLGLIGGWFFLQVVDTEQRPRWILVGCLVSAAGWLGATIWPTPAWFVVLVVCFAVGASLSGEAAYKVWTQELVPTLLRATVQGATLAAARVAAGLFALVTPAIASASPRWLFGTLLVAQVTATLIAVRWLPRFATRPVGTIEPTSPT